MLAIDQNFKIVVISKVGLLFIDCLLAWDGEVKSCPMALRNGILNLTLLKSPILLIEGSFGGHKWEPLFSGPCLQSWKSSALTSSG